MTQLTLTDLRCEYRTNPLGIDEPSPRLSWKLETPRRGAKQTAYQVRVAPPPRRWQQARTIYGTAGASSPINPYRSLMPGPRYSPASARTGKCASGMTQAAPPKARPRGGKWDSWRAPIGTPRSGLAVRCWGASGPPCRCPICGAPLPSTACRQVRACMSPRSVCMNVGSTANASGKIGSPPAGPII